MANTYESIAFLTRDEAQEPIRILKEKGEAAALEFLQQFHEPGEGTLVCSRSLITSNTLIIWRKAH